MVDVGTRRGRRMFCEAPAVSQSLDEVMSRMSGQLPEWLCSAGDGLHWADLMRLRARKSARPCEGSCTGKASKAVDAFVGAAESTVNKGVECDEQ